MSIASYQIIVKVTKTITNSIERCLYGSENTLQFSFKSSKLVAIQQRSNLLYDEVAYVVERPNIFPLKTSFFGGQPVVLGLKLLAETQTLRICFVHKTDLFFLSFKGFQFLVNGSLVHSLFAAHYTTTSRASVFANQLVIDRLVKHEFIKRFGLGKFIARFERQILGRPDVHFEAQNLSSTEEEALHLRSSESFVLLSHLDLF